jgi:hypothetical protein
MLRKMGAGAIALRGEDKFALLALLERGGLYPSLFLCSSCLCFHRPRFPFPESLPGRAFRSGQARRDCDEALSRTGCDISFGAAAAVLRSARLGNDIYPPSLLSAQKSYATSFGARRRDRRYAPAAVTRSVEARVHGARLLVRTEWVFDSGAPRHLAPEVAGPGLSRIVKEWPVMAHACVHNNWSVYYPDFLSGASSADSGRRYRCLWSHNGLCRGPACGWVPYEQAPATWAPRGCGDCVTDFEYMRRDVRVDGPEKEHRTLVLVAWQDLGEGRRADDRTWTARLGRKRVSRDLLAPGKIRRDFESCSGK